MAVALINRGLTTELTYEEVSELLGLASPTDFEDYLRDGRSTITFEFIDLFAETFAVNGEWLRTGRGHPFSNRDPSKYNPLLYLDLLRQLDVIRICFVTADTARAEAFVVVQQSDIKYRILNDMWLISGFPGAGGQRQLWQLYNFIRLVRDDAGFFCTGLQLAESEFSKLYRGKVFPGVYLNPYRQVHHSDWWDDLTDIYNDHFSAEGYRSTYGDSFVTAQLTLREYDELKGRQ